MGDLIYEDAIRRQFDVHHVEGREFICRCQWHDDGGRPNLSVNGESGLYQCWVCGAKGKVGTLTEEEQVAALRARLKAAANPEVEVIQTKPESWLKQFTPHPYWHTARKFTRSTIEKWQLGYDPSTNRLTIPVRDTQGKLMGAIYRALDDSKPKYMHPVGFRTGRHLFGAHMLKGKHKVALVEGPLDAIACWDARVPALAVYGARLTDDQAQLLRILGVDVLVPMFDNDSAGRAAASMLKDTVPDMIIHEGEWMWPYAKDPGELRPEHRREFWQRAGGVIVPSE